MSDDIGHHVRAGTRSARRALLTLTALAITLACAASACGDGDFAETPSAVAVDESGAAPDDTETSAEPAHSDSVSDAEEEALIAALTQSFIEDGIEPDKAACTAEGFVEQVGVVELAEQGVTLESPEIPIDPEADDVNPLFVIQAQVGITC